MPELPHQLLDRDLPPVAMAQGFKPQLDLLVQMTNYASNLVLRAYSSKRSKKELHDLIVCHVLLKQVAVMLDSIEILAKAGAIPAAWVPARVAFEASLYLEWMLQADGPEKAAYYYVANVRAEKVWGLRVLKGSPEAMAFQEEIKELGDVDLHGSNEELEAMAQSLIAEANRILAQEKLKAVNDAFQAYLAPRRKRGKVPFEPEWYKVYGKWTVRKIANDLKRLHEYALHYSKGSRVAHSASTKDHISVGPHGVDAHSIRNLAGTRDLFGFVFSNAIHTFRKVLEYYRPEELSRFQTQYLQEWQSAFMNVPHVKIEKIRPKV